MGLAEQKIELLKIVTHADEETIGALIDIVEQHDLPSHQFTKAEIVEFEKRRDDFFASGEKGFTMEESLQSLRNKIL